MAVGQSGYTNEPMMDNTMNKQWLVLMGAAALALRPTDVDPDARRVRIGDRVAGLDDLAASEVAQWIARRAAHGAEGAGRAVHPSRHKLASPTEHLLASDCHDPVSWIG